MRGQFRPYCGEQTDCKVLGRRICVRNGRKTDKQTEFKRLFNPNSGLTKEEQEARITAKKAKKEAKAAEKKAAKETKNTDTTDTENK